MAKTETTVGRLLVNRALPEDMQLGPGVELDKKTTAKVLKELAERHPEQYRDTLKKLMDVGREVSYTSGSHSFGVRHLKTAPSAQQARLRLQQKLHSIFSDKSLSPEDQSRKIIEATSVEHERLMKEVLGEATGQQNPLAEQVVSGARGNVATLKRLIAGDMLYTDNKDRVIPLPVTKTYSEGLSPPEYWASTFGARKGLVDVKLATQRAGYLSKQMNQVTHRLMVTESDDPTYTHNPDSPRGLPVDTDDDDNEGALLAVDTAGYKRNEILTPKILRDIKDRGFDKILIRSPTVGGPADGGVYGRDVGIREKGIMAPLGDEVGMAAAQGLSERITQGMLGSKHSGGVKGESKSVGGYPLINSMLQVPKHFPGGATHAQTEGTISSVREAPAGGWHVMINNQDHYVPAEEDLKVKQGDTVEAGDVLCTGTPNPAEIVRHKGIGEGRRYYSKAFTEAFRSSSMPAKRRNVELLARGLIDHVAMTEDTDDNSVGDILHYHRLERNWTPRVGYETKAPTQSVGRYLERPVLHHTIGTKISPSMAKEMDEMGVKQILTHQEVPPFEPHMVRAISNLEYDDDIMAQFLGAHQKSNLLEAARVGGGSDVQSTSFAPALATGTIGKIWPNIVLRPSAR